jgi:hypothetical protein
MTNPILRTGLAVLRKKPTDKSRVVETDQKALDTAEFLETIEMFNSMWNVFEDVREWQWTQAAELPAIRIAISDEIVLEEEFLPEEQNGSISAE